MHPALERLIGLANDTETIADQLQETGWLTGKEAQQLMAQANALHALIAALVEIEERARVSDDNSVFDVEILQIIHKHLEPLK